MQYKIIVDKQPSSNPSEEKKEYIIDIEELRVKGDVYDSLNIEMDRTYVTRRLSLSEYGVLSVLDEPVIQELTDLDIKLFEGDNYIYLMDMQGNKFYAEYLVKNDFTDLYVTTNQMNSAITQTAESIEFSVNQKLEGYSTTEEMNAAINIKAGEITSSVSKTYSTKEELNTAKSEIKQTTDSITSTVSTKVGKTEVISSINQSAEAVQINANKISLKGKNINLTGDNTTISSTNFNVDKNGNMTCKNANVSGTITSSNANITGGSIKVGNNFTVNSSGNMTCSNVNITGGKVTLEADGNDNSKFRIVSSDGTKEGYMTSDCLRVGAFQQSISLYAFLANPSISLADGSGSGTVVASNQITTPKLTQTSLESIKKNINKFTKNATDIINNSDIYEYNLKSDEDTDKKMIGFVIGDKYRTPNEVIDKEGRAVELYSAIGILWKAVQELSARVEQLEKEAQHE